MDARTTDGRGWMDELLYCAIAWTEHNRSLHPRLLLKKREKEEKEEEDSHDPGDSDGDSGILESSSSLSLSLSLCFSPLSNPSRILPTVSLYLVSLRSSRSGNDFYQVTDEFVSSSDDCWILAVVVVRTISRVHTMSTRVLHHLLIMDLLYKVCWSGRGNVKVYTQCC